jgi:hypothetical protein
VYCWVLGQTDRKPSSQCAVLCGGLMYYLLSGVSGGPKRTPFEYVEQAITTCCCWSEFEKCFIDQSERRLLPAHWNVQAPKVLDEFVLATIVNKHMRYKVTCIIITPKKNMLLTLVVLGLRLKCAIARLDHQCHHFQLPPPRRSRVRQQQTSGKEYR